MTSHYMLCKVSGSFEQITEYLSKYFGTVHNEHWNTPEGRTAIAFGESYFIRTNSNAAVLLILKEVSESETNLELISCAGASGVLELSWDAHGSYVRRIKDSLQRAGYNTKVIKEIPNYNPSPLGTF